MSAPHPVTVKARVALGCGLAVVVGGAFGAATLAASHPIQPNQWGLERGVTIGDAFDEVTGLTGVGSVVRFGDHLVVGQPLERRLRVFLPTGDFVRFLGRRGQGPGEFEALGRIGLRGDLIWTWDSELHRIQYFDAEYNYVATVAIRGHPSVPAADLGVAGVLRDGSILVRLMNPVTTAISAPRAPTWILRLDSLGIVRDTVAGLRGLRPVTELTDGVAPGRRVYSIRPVYDQSLLSVAPDGSAFAVVHRERPPGEPHVYRVVVRAADGDTVFVRDYPYEPVSVTASWLSEELDDHLARRAVGPSTSVANQRRYRAGLEDAFGELEFFPPVASLLLDREGYTWLLLRTGEETFEWRVLDQVGATLGRFTEPAGAILRAPDVDGGWFTEKDAFDIPYLVRYNFRKR